MPAVRTPGRWRDAHGPAVFVALPGDLYRAARFQVDVARPGHLGEGFSHEQFSILPVDDIEETILRCVHQRLHGAAVHFQVGQDDVHVRVVVPGFPGSGLVVPAVFAGVGVQGDDRTQEQVVASSGTTDLPVPGRAVAGTDVKQVEFSVVGKAVPGVTSAAEFPPLAGPRFRSHAHGIVLETVGRITGHDPETPRLLASLGIVGGDVAPIRAGLGAAVADEHLAFENLGSAGDVEWLGGVEGAHAPHLLAGLPFHGDQPPVPCGQVNLVLPEADAAVVFPAHAQVGTGLLGHARVVHPHLLVRAEIDRVDPIHALDEVDHAVRHQWRRDQSTRPGHVAVPVHGKPAHAIAIDLVQWTESLLAVGASEGQPVAPVFLLTKSFIVDDRCRRGCGIRRVIARHGFGLRRWGCVRFA